MEYFFSDAFWCNCSSLRTDTGNPAKKNKTGWDNPKSDISSGTQKKWTFKMLDGISDPTPEDLDS